MKKFKFLAMLMAAFALSLSFAACGDDDDDDNGQQGGSPELVGTWVDDENYVEIIEPNADYSEVGGKVELDIRLTLTKDGKATASMNHLRSSNDGTYHSEKLKSTGTYKVSGSKLIITYTEMNEEWASAWIDEYGKLQKESDKHSDRLQEPDVREFTYSVQGKKLTLIDEWRDSEGNVQQTVSTFTKE